ncbi:MAG: RDD family protein [Pseudomonadales bacterium]
MSAKSTTTSQTQESLRAERLSQPNARLLVRIAALIYDSFLVVAIWMLSSLLLVAVTDLGEGLTGPLYQAFLYLELLAFYIYFWSFRGQTLGMQVWRLQVVSESGDILNRRKAMLRFLTATPSVGCLGIGLLWVLVNPERAALHDLLSKTRVIQLPKQTKKS